MTDFQLKYKPYGSRSILIEWPSKIEDIVLRDVLIFKKHINFYLDKEILYINHAYNSILIVYASTIDIINDRVSVLKRLYSSRIDSQNITNKLWKIPVCYDEKFAIDLAIISEEKQCSKQQIIEWHSEAIYTIYFIGFLPGFLYLGGLNEKLFCPRKSSPRMQIEKGAVAIGGQQTGIYPNSSPGGWQIIGNSPLTFFDISKKPPCFAISGDKLQFQPITFMEHQDILAQVKDNTYTIESEVIYD